MSVAVSAGPVAEGERGRRLGASLRRAERAQRVRALLLVLPAIVFLVVAFVFLRSGLDARRGRSEPGVRDVMPRTAAAMIAWDGAGVPPQATIAAFVGELRQATADGSIGRVARRVNYGIPGFRSVLLRTGRSLPPPETPDADLLAALAGIDSHRSDPAYWLALKGAAPAVTDFYLLAAADLRRAARGAIVKAPPEQAVLHHRFRPDLLGEPGGHRVLRVPGLSDRASPRVPPAAARQPADDPGPAALLDLGAGPDHGVAGAAPAAKAS